MKKASGIQVKRVFPRFYRCLPFASLGLNHTHSALKNNRNRKGEGRGAVTTSDCKRKTLALMNCAPRVRIGKTILGLILVAFPVQVGGLIPSLMGLSSLLYALVNIIISVKYPDTQTRLGDGIVRGVTGAIVLFMKTESISVLGVIWAMQSLKEVAEEIDEYHATKRLSLVSGISIVVSIVLAAMLMMDPFEHFNTHVRILGLEILASAFIRRRKGAAGS